jgi:transposase
VRHALLVVLGCSCLLRLRFSARQDMHALGTGPEEVFGCFSGVPRKLLFDQIKLIITCDLRLLGGQLIRNEECLRFAAHRGSTPRACRPYRTQTKSKVERPMRYVRDNFAKGTTSSAISTWRRSASAGWSGRTHASMRPRARCPAHASSRTNNSCSCRWLRGCSLPRRLPPQPEAAAHRTLPMISVERRPLTTDTRLIGGAR